MSEPRPDPQDVAGRTVRVRLERPAPADRDPWSPAPWQGFAPADRSALKRLTPHEMAELQAWTNGIGRDSRELVERLIAEDERARFALNEIAVHLEGLQHVRKLTTAEQAVLGQAREGLR